jgi:putative membrane protein
MPAKPIHRSVPDESRAAEHLANERTFLAWVRTTIALISLGFILARFAPWLSAAPGAAEMRRAAFELGLGLVGLGALLTLLAAWRYHVLNRAIELGRVKDDRVLVWFLTALVIVASAALVAVAINLE